MKIFEEGMFLKTFSTTLLQKFCKISINSKVVIKSIIDPDDNYKHILTGVLTRNQTELGTAATRADTGEDYVHEHSIEQVSIHQERGQILQPETQPVRALFMG